MPSAVLFLPCHIIEFTNFVTRSEPYTGSASTLRFAICPFLGIQLLARALQTQPSYVSTEIFMLSGAWRRTSNGFACGLRPLPRPAFLEPRGSVRRADLSRDRLESTRSSALASYGRRLGCKS